MKKLAQIFNDRSIQMKIAELETTTGLKKMHEEFSPEQDHLISIVSNGQRGRIEEQRCSLGPRTTQQAPVYSPAPDEIYQLLVNSQSHRLDEQRVMLNSLPGMEAFTMREPKEANALKISFDQICNMVSRTHSFRRRTPPKNLRTPKSPGFSLTKPTQHCDDSSNKLPSRSTSFSPDKDSTDYESFQGEQDNLFCLVSEAQRGRIEDQRCSINPLSHSTSHIDNIQSDQDADQFFKPIANTQNRRLNDQRATLPATSDITGQESDQLFNIISRLQGFRIDDQRCFAPQIQLGSPTPPRKFHSKPLSESGSSRRSTSFGSVSEDHCSDQDQFFSLIHHAQKTRMDDQRCSFEPSKHSSFTPISLNTTPIGFKSSSTGNQRERNMNPQIILTPASPATPKKPDSRPASPILMLCDSEPLPRSASFCPVLEKERLLKDDMPMQITFQISMRLPPHESCQFPEVFLTIGQPGETIVLPLSFKPGRPVINPHKKHHSRSTSPHGSPARQECGRPSSLNPKNPGPVSPHKDYFSLIQGVHSTQLQQNNEPEREEMNREAKTGKGKNSGRKEKKRRK